MLLSLDNDAVIQVLSHLTADELARFVCASHGTKSVGQRDACWASHVESISAQYATEESHWPVAYCCVCLPRVRACLPLSG